MSLSSNISFISWQSLLLVEETGIPGENLDLPQVADKLYHIMCRVHVSKAGFELATLLVIYTD
jgi:hypothetical protein